jgi:hypothetical protein
MHGFAHTRVGWVVLVAASGCGLVFPIPDLHLVDATAPSDGAPSDASTDRAVEQSDGSATGRDGGADVGANPDARGAETGGNDADGADPGIECPPGRGTQPQICARGTFCCSGLQDFSCASSCPSTSRSVACDDARDCDAGESCCYDRSGSLPSIHCASACELGGTVCDPGDPNSCESASGQCMPIGPALSGFSTCH